MGLTNDIDQSGQDFSGLDVSNKIFTEIDFHESVFNGTYFENVIFDSCNLKHIEFTESKFTNCQFENCQLDYSDFVYVNCLNSNFKSCSFSHVEWRETEFKKVNFENCSFYSSTITLCTFSENNFDNKSSLNFYGVSKRYNVFSSSTLRFEFRELEFLKYNYGLTLYNFQLDPPYWQGKESNNLLNLSILELTHKFNTEIFIELISNEILQLYNQKNRLQKLKYINLICRITVQNNKLSVFALQILINRLNSCASQLTEPSLFMEMVDLVMHLKTFQYKSIQDIERDLNDIDNQNWQGINCKYTLSNTYSKEDVESHINQICFFLNISKEYIALTSFKNGSTIFEIIIKCSVSIGAFLLFINFSLAQIHKTIDYLAKIKKNLKYLRGKKSEANTKDDKNKESYHLTPLSVMSNEGNIYYSQINNVVQKFGTDLIKIEGEGHISINHNS